MDPIRVFKLDHGPESLAEGLARVSVTHNYVYDIGRFLWHIYVL